ncbi:MAG: hypothetical protein HY902_17650, partial [Deltaproteobacteria bacterium]|nr:hypothetical protein [Deltaproteobacteria bacterium]
MKAFVYYVVAASMAVASLGPTPVHAGERGETGQFRRMARVTLANLPPLDTQKPRRSPGPPRDLERAEAAEHAKLPLAPPPPRSPGTQRKLGETRSDGPPARIATLFTAQTRSDYPIGPPDTTGAVGKNHLITGTNIAISVHDRTGKTLKIVDINDFWQPLAGGNSYCGDPRFVYDPLVDRFYSVVMALGYQDHKVRLLLAHSQTGDPSGEWQQVELPMPATHSIDQPLLGFSANRVVVQANDFVGTLDKPTGAAVRTRIYSIDKADLLAGG